MVLCNIILLQNFPQSETLLDYSLIMDTIRDIENNAPGPSRNIENIGESSDIEIIPNNEIENLENILDNMLDATAVRMQRARIAATENRRVLRPRIPAAVQELDVSDSDSDETIDNGELNETVEPAPQAAKTLPVFDDTDEEAEVPDSLLPDAADKHHNPKGLLKFIMRSIRNHVDSPDGHAHTDLTIIGDLCKLAGHRAMYATAVSFAVTAVFSTSSRFFDDNGFGCFQATDHAANYILKSKVKGREGQPIGLKDGGRRITAEYYAKELVDRIEVYRSMIATDPHQGKLMSVYYKTISVLLTTGYRGLHFLQNFSMFLNTPEHEQDLIIERKKEWILEWPENLKIENTSMWGEAMRLRNYGIFPTRKECVRKLINFFNFVSTEYVVADTPKKTTTKRKAPPSDASPATKMAYLELVKEKNMAEYAELEAEQEKIEKRLKEIHTTKLRLNTHNDTFDIICKQINDLM